MECVECVMNIDVVYDGMYLVGKCVFVMGVNRGVGLALCEELTRRGAEVVAMC